MRNVVEDTEAALRTGGRRGLTGGPPARRGQISSGSIAIAPAGHSAAHRPQPLQ
jgi:hypothetical protein